MKTNLFLTCCLTGHRPSKLPWQYNENSITCKHFKKDLKRALDQAINDGVKVFLTGMAEGFDIIATEILLKLRSKYKDIKILAIIPCKDQEKLWSTSQQKRYRKIIQKCNDQIILCDHYTTDCMKQRNEYMVKHSDVVIACFDGANGGTKHTISFAQSRNLHIRIIDPQIYR